MSQTLYWFYKVRKEDIYQIKNILEGYENILNISTIDKSIPKVQISVASDFADDARAIVKDLSERFFMEELHDDQETSQGRY